MSGMHLLLDGVTTGFSVEESVALLYAVTEAAEMTLIAGPDAKATPDGICAWAIIAESHIILSRHGPVVHCDIFSCKEFDFPLLVGILESGLNLLTFSAQVLHRQGVRNEPG